MTVTIETQQKYKTGDMVYTRTQGQARVIKATWDTDVVSPEYIGWHYNVEFVNPQHKGYKGDYLHQNDLKAVPWSW